MTDGTHSGCFLEFAQRALEGSLARSERARQARCRPRFAALEQSENRAGRPVDRRSQHHDSLSLDQGKRETALGRLEASEPAQCGAQAAQFDAEPRPVRLVQDPRLEGALDKVIARDVGWPGLSEGANELEKDGTPRERDTASATANQASAPIDDQVAG